MIISHFDSSCIHTLRDEFQSTFESEWIREVERVEARRGNGLNKLRTYAKFKSVFGLEPYLMHVRHEGKRLLLFKFRAGIAPLGLETGRYESNVDALTGQAIKERITRRMPYICPCCYGSIENEIHFLLKCPRYTRSRGKLLYAYCIYCNIKDKPYPEDDRVLFNFLMSCQDFQVVNALANYLWDSFNDRTVFLGL